MRMIHSIGRAIARLIAGSVVGTVTVAGRAIDAAIASVGRLSERLDAWLQQRIRESNARRRIQGRRQVDPITPR